MVTASQRRERIQIERYLRPDKIFKSIFCMLAPAMFHYFYNTLNTLFDGAAVSYKFGGVGCPHPFLTGVAPSINYSNYLFVQHQFFLVRD